MPTYEQLPGRMNLSFVAGDQFGAQIGFDSSLVGSTVTSTILSAVTGETVVGMTTSVADAVSGVVNVSLTEAQTQALATGTYNWEMIVIQPGDVQRTFLTGIVEVK